VQRLYMWQHVSPINAPARHATHSFDNQRARYPHVMIVTKMSADLLHFAASDGQFVYMLAACILTCSGNLRSGVMHAPHDVLHDKRGL
jgi:hypothetical protein